MSIQMISGTGGVAATRGGDVQRTPPPAGAAAAIEPQPAAAASSGPQGSVDSDQVKEAARKINEQLTAMRQGLQFSVDEATGHTIVRVLDSETGQTIRQIPSEEALAISQSLERLQGVLLKQEA